MWFFPEAVVTVASGRNAAMCVSTLLAQRAWGISPKPCGRHVCCGCRRSSTVKHGQAWSSRVKQGGFAWLAAVRMRSCAVSGVHVRKELAARGGAVSSFRMPMCGPRRRSWIRCCGGRVRADGRAEGRAPVRGLPRLPCRTWHGRGRARWRLGRGAASGVLVRKPLAVVAAARAASSWTSLQSWEAFAVVGRVDVRLVSFESECLAVFDVK